RLRARSQADNAREAKRWSGALAEQGLPLVADAPLLRFSRVSKRFGGTVAVDDVSLDLHAGEILALLGENGAGKSTLIKMLAGVYSQDSGSVFLQDRPEA